MLWSMRAVMFVSYAVVGALGKRALTAFVGGAWQTGLKLAAAVVVLLFLAVLGMGLLGAAYATSQGAQLEPSAKARFLGEAIATQMNFGAVGFLVGVTLSALLERRRPSAGH